MAKTINFQKIKEEFVKAKNKIKKLFCGLRAVFILCIILIIFLFISPNTTAKDSIISYLPDNTILYAHIASLANDKKITDFFAEKMAGYLKIPREDIYNKIFPFVGQEVAIAVLQNNNNETSPFFIFKNQDHLTKGILLPNITIENLTEKKLIILSKNNNEFKKFQGSSNFKNSAQIKKFTKKYSPDLTFYIDINKIYSAENSISLLDNAILEKIKDKGEILAGIKKINNFYEMSIADIEQNIFSKIKFQDEASEKYNEKIIFSAKTNILDDISFLPKEFFKDFLNLKNEGIEIILTRGANNPQKNNSDNSLHNQIMLNGENSVYQYVIALKNNEENQENLEKIKNFFINYLDEKLPEERIASLPDGSFMTELWSNPKRFVFGKNEDSPIYSLKNTQLNFEFTYSGNKNIILLSNSENALKNYLSKKLEPETDGEETFFINTASLKNNGIIINTLNYFGDYADGRLIKTP